MLLLQAIKSVGMWEAMTEEELNEMMEAADINGDGTIDYNGGCSVTYLSDKLVDYNISELQ